jgi:tetratricopeptide (TPR) repeat protein
VGAWSRYDQAIADYSKAIEINPKDGGIYCNRRRVYYLRKQYDESLEDFNKAQALGYKIPAEFLESLRKAQGN